MEKVYFLVVVLWPFIVSQNLLAQPENHGEEHEKDRHSFIQVNHVSERESAEDITLHGFSILGRYDLTTHFFLRGEIERVTETSAKEKAAEIAMAYILNPHAPVEFHIAGLYNYADIEEEGRSESADAYGAELGFHSPLTEYLMLHGELAWLTGGGDALVGAELGVLLRLNERLGLNAEYARDEDSNEALELGVRFSF